MYECYLTPKDAPPPSVGTNPIATLCLLSPNLNVQTRTSISEFKLKFGSWYEVKTVCMFWPAPPSKHKAYA